MRIACISKTFLTGGGYGLGRYSWTMVQHLKSSSPNIQVFPCALTRKSLPHENPIENLSYSPFLGRHTENVWRTLKFPPLEWWTPSHDVVHSLDHLFPVVTRKPWVITIHDLMPITHHQFFSLASPAKFQEVIDFAVERAAGLICISQFTADALQDFYPKHDLTDRIHVTPLGVDKFFLEDAVDTSQLINSILAFDAPYLMLSAMASPRKNFVRAIDAFDLVAEELPHHLVMTGKLGWDSEPLLERIERSPYKDRIHRVGEVSTEQLRTIYRHASIHLYISLMEGFGLPIVEAMACGCPVIASNVSSMPEVAGGAACLTDPYDVPAIAAAILKVANDPTYREELIEKGKKRAQEMSWERCVQKTIDVYQKVAK